MKMFDLVGANRRRVLAGLVGLMVLPVACAWGGKADDMDYGPCLGASVLSRPESRFHNSPGSHTGDSTARGLMIKLEEGWRSGVVFDMDLMRMSAGWVDGGIRLKGVVFDGGHGPNPGLGSVPLFQTPTLPGWSDSKGAFKDPRPNTISPLPPPAPLPKSWAHYKGYYLHGDRVILSYTVGNVPVLELPGVEKLGPMKALVRTIRVGASGEPMSMMVADGNPEVPGTSHQRAGGVADDDYDPNPDEDTVLGRSSGLTAHIGELNMALVGAPVGSKLEATYDGTIVLRLPKLEEAATFKVLYLGGGVASRAGLVAMLRASPKPENLPELTRGGPARWTEEVVTKGTIAKPSEAAYVVDRITLPFNNPYKSWMRVGGFDFFEGGTRAALSTWSGDVWIVSGIDESLAELKWKRFATGLHQPLGLKIVDGVIYTVGRDQITRFHDLNDDGEADFYENFNNDWELTAGFHAYSFDLHTDPLGNFVFAMGSPVHAGGRGFQKITRHHGAILKVSPDGQRLTTYATGLRAPNGIGVSKTGQITTGDNEGSWVPRSPLHWVTEGKFLSVKDAAQRELTAADLPPRPLCWFPKSVDNSGGGQVWVESSRWGPFEGELLHMSYGRSSLYLVLKEEVDGVMQGGVVKFPLKFTSSAMRARFNPRDGQLYVSGLRGWQSNAARDGGLDRVRFTGKPVRMVSGLHALKGGMVVEFTCALDPETAGDPENWSVSMTNIKWSSGYGSGEYSVLNGEQPRSVKGKDQLDVKSAKVSADGRSVRLELPQMQPCDMMQIRYAIDSADGVGLRDSVWNTVHGVR